MFFLIGPLCCLEMMTEDSEECGKIFNEVDDDESK